MALDLPTGWDCDLGPCGADVFQADLTYTMVAGKKSFPQPGVTSSLGEVVIGDIGIPPELIAQVMAGPPSVE
jgi:hypothetical protein